MRSIQVTEEAMLALLEERAAGSPPRELTPEELTAYLRECIAARTARDEASKRAEATRRALKARLMRPVSFKSR